MKRLSFLFQPKNPAAAYYSCDSEVVVIVSDVPCVPGGFIVVGTWDYLFEVQCQYLNGQKGVELVGKM